MTLYNRPEALARALERLAACTANYWAEMVALGAALALRDPFVPKNEKITVAARALTDIRHAIREERAADAARFQGPRYKNG